MTNTKYNCSEGCCICGTKNSTSQFRPWYEHYPEDVYCRVFELDSLAGRKGKVCNPCVLYIKRAHSALTNPAADDRAKPDHTKRLDCKLNGRKRQKTDDILPPGPSQCGQPPTKELGYFARNMRIQPRYVFTGKKYIILRSKYQLLPAGPWQDPREFLEDEDDAEQDLPYYRSITLKKGIKTIREKAEKKRQDEAKEYAKYFGEINEEYSSNTANNGARKDSAETACKIQTRFQASQQQFSMDSLQIKNKRKRWEQVNSSSDETKETDPYEDVSECNNAAKAETENLPSTSQDEFDISSSSSAFELGSENSGTQNSSFATETELKNQSREQKRPAFELDSENTGMQNSSFASGIEGKTQSRKRMRLWRADDQVRQMKYLQMFLPSADTNIKHSDGTGQVKNRRVMQTPAKRDKHFLRTFYDLAYWQKFPLCCCDIMVGEAKIFGYRPNRDIWGRCQCNMRPLSTKNLRRLNILPPRQPRKRPKCPPSANGQTKNMDKASQKEDDKTSEEAEISSNIKTVDETDSIVKRSEEAHKNRMVSTMEESDADNEVETCSYISSVSSRVDELNDISMAVKATDEADCSLAGKRRIKATEESDADKDIETCSDVSVMSSGVDELSDTRDPRGISPLVEDSFTVEVAKSLPPILP